MGLTRKRPSVEEEKTREAVAPEIAVMAPMIAVMMPVMTTVTATAPAKTATAATGAAAAVTAILPLSQRGGMLTAWPMLGDGPEIFLGQPRGDNNATVSLVAAMDDLTRMKYHGGLQSTT